MLRPASTHLTQRHACSDRIASVYPITKSPIEKTKVTTVKAFIVVSCSEKCFQTFETDQNSYSCCLLKLKRSLIFLFF